MMLSFGRYSLPRAFSWLVVCCHGCSMINALNILKIIFVYLLLSLPLHAQEDGGFIDPNPTPPPPDAGEEFPTEPIQQSAYWILGNIQVIPVQTQSNWQASARLSGYRIAHFYAQALTYGKIPNRHHWYVPYGSLSPQWDTCQPGPEYDDCVDRNVHYAALRDYAQFYQCRPEAGAPAQIVVDHFINNYKHMFRIFGASDTKLQNFLFYRPRIGAGATERLNGESVVDSSVNQLYLEAIQYVGPNRDLSALALNNPTEFERIYQDYVERPIPATMPEYLPNHTTAAKNTFYRDPRYDIRLRMTSIQSPLECEWDAAMNQWRFKFREGDYWDDGFADGTPPYNYETGDYDFADHDIGNKNPDIDYTPVPEDEYRDVDGYIPPGMPGSVWDEHPDNPNPPTGEDENGNPTYGDDPFCPRDKNGCLEDEEGLDIEGVSDFGLVSANIRNVLAPLIDISALQGARTCPSWNIRASLPGFSVNENLEIDCKWLAMAGNIVLLLASALAFRQVFGS